MLKMAGRFIACGGLLAAVTLGAQAAHAAPDLVIQKSDSEVKFVGCEEGQPLATGRLVIRNEGDSDANLRGANELFRSFVAVYVPENIDLIEKDTKRTKMEPREQRAIEFTLGAGKVKKGRNYNALPNGDSSSAADPAKDAKLARDIQAFLKSRGYVVSVDGDWGAGSKRALKSFQENQKLKATGEWNAETQAAIEKLTGVAAGMTVDNVKDAQGRTRITIFAVVDPYNLIDESNERNNIVTYTGYLACD
ncbi:exported protein of unknown function [Candidatus Filomicrobium marinum]|uniref:Peptidoglycan binding-like domain-containing protein n=3 Tax=Hyphomicrobiaceae TaxID=45401 RepID=A0A0D6JA44_9HYPH|nr:exported protein of unknown function [Candidatus Filomicrobium marinum]CPR14662.1 exported protein of unknown function [Candidatus Filomicrobium marinum]SDO77424.1 Putative peptidoglycan binding domain-containing protein [Filomicrobium insigne]